MVDELGPLPGTIVAAGMHSLAAWSLKMCTRFTGQMVFLLALASVGTAHAAAAYTWTEILVPNTMVVSAYGPNDLGEVAVTNRNGTTGIYRYGRFTPLSTPPVGVQVTADGINDVGTVVGIATTTSDSHEQGFILTQGHYRFFSRLGWQNTEPHAIGTSGLVTGASYQDTGEYAGFVYDPATGSFTDVTPFGSAYTIAQGINKFGRISGSGADDNLGRYAFIWQQAAVGLDSRELVPFLDRIQIADGFANARGINDDGIIAGWAKSAGQNVGFVGSASRGYELLIPPGGDAAGASTVCEGINNTGQVACVVTDTAGNSRGFVGSLQ